MPENTELSKVQLNLVLQRQTYQLCKQKLRCWFCFFCTFHRNIYNSRVFVIFLLLSECYLESLEREREKFHHILDMKEGRKLKLKILLNCTKIVQNILYYVILIVCNFKYNCIVFKLYKIKTCAVMHRFK